MRVLVCGDRNWGALPGQSVKLVTRMGQLPPGTVVIEGCARGADSEAESNAKALGFELLHFPAQWDKYGRAAGAKRNQQMLDEGKPELVIAFHPDIAASKGTGDMVRRARKAGILVEVWA